MSDLEKMSESVILDTECRPDADDIMHTIPKRTDFQALKDLKIPGLSERPNTKPGFLCMALPDCNQDEACNCESKDSCSNVHCIIQHHMQNRPYMRRTYKDQSGLIIVPIEKSYGHDYANDEVDEIDGDGLLDVEFSSETPTGAVEMSETSALCKDIDKLIQAKLKQMTNLEKPSTTEELALFLQATDSNEFRKMLADKYDEIAASENGTEKVKMITKHFGNRNR